MAPILPAGAVSTLTPADVAGATDVLAGSHADYPAFAHVWPDPVVRRRALRPFLRAGVVDGAELGRSCVAREGNHAVAVALWLGPGEFPWSPSRKLRATGAFLVTAMAAPRAFPSLARIGAAAERTHPEGAHWYLQTLGVRPGAQGHGWGRRVLQPGLDRADADGIACYVETSDPANQAFYATLGFELTAPRLEHLAGAPPYLGMTRPPRR